MKIERILIEDQMAPIGLDEKKPAFSWLLTAEEGEQNLMQSACRIVVRTGQRFTKLILCRSLMTAPGKSQLLWIPS